ncbi:UDP-glucose/GDP-mannose dehydrogenase family protein [Phreatobacter aquaticus]|uniref:UDP-glucose 6-dehydrogenase n=1 Tax=Phreatobacter aquaticus TaxID=2570229 RepID=A0A4D7QMJ2_9HYPH|nr:UDP-glucose/GDP-mannose dehydrogenase family protein [Phreatobacter aquaticus]QCK86849.1 UDP-glucose/GDP-mannose dehydrogenase family protein [Phreatobacter aquaticus]
MRCKITVIGTGYVGLVTGTCFAEIGHEVICVDKDARKIGMLESGRVPIYEPGLEDMVERNMKAGRLSFSLDLAESCRDRDAIYIAVGTPSDPETGRADLSQVHGAAEEIGRALSQFSVIITKSTVPVGTNRMVAELARAVAASPDFVAVASNPEFMREGAAISDFMEPDRVVIGVEDPRASTIMQRIYAPLVEAEVPMLVTGIETAEMIKYAANSFLATKLSFINEVSDLCEAVGANIEEVARGIGLDKRIGLPFLKVGPGWGGSCFPKDTLAFQMTAQDAGVPARIIGAAIAANDARKASMADRVLAACGGSLEGKKVAVLGVTFKGQTDDMRESPSLSILPRLIAMGASVDAYDPAQPRDAQALLGDVRLVADPLDAVADADVLVVVTEWKVFRSYDLATLASRMRTKTLVDLRNLFSPAEAEQAGFASYSALGLSTKAN